VITVFVSAKRKGIIATIATKRTISVARTIARGKSKNAIAIATGSATIVAIGVATRGVISVVISIVSLTITTIIAIAIATGSATIVAIGVATRGVISVVISIVSLSITTVIAIAIATGSATIATVVATIVATGITQDELKEVGVKKTRKYLIYAFLCFFVF